MLIVPCRRSVPGALHNSPKLLLLEQRHSNLVRKLCCRSSMKAFHSLDVIFKVAINRPSCALSTAATSRSADHFCDEVFEPRWRHPMGHFIHERIGVKARLVHHTVDEMINDCRNAVYAAESAIERAFSGIGTLLSTMAPSLSEPMTLRCSNPLLTLAVLENAAPLARFVQPARRDPPPLGKSGLIRWSPFRVSRHVLAFSREATIAQPQPSLRPCVSSNRTRDPQNSVPLLLRSPLQDQLERCAGDGGR